MALYIGDKKVKEMYVGTKKVVQMYEGNTVEDMGLTPICVFPTITLNIEISTWFSNYSQPYDVDLGGAIPFFEEYYALDGWPIRHSINVGNLTQVQNDLGHPCVRTKLDLSGATKFVKFGWELPGNKDRYIQVYWKGSYQSYLSTRDSNGNPDMTISLYRFTFSNVKGYTLSDFTLNDGFQFDQEGHVLSTLHSKMSDLYSEDWPIYVGDPKYKQGSLSYSWSGTVGPYGYFNIEVPLDSEIYFSTRIDLAPYGAIDARYMCLNVYYNLHYDYDSPISAPTPIQILGASIIFEDGHPYNSLGTSVSSSLIS